MKVAVALPPDVHRRVVDIVHGAHRGRIAGCAHLERFPVATLCLMHPDRLRCPQCHLRHAKTHTEAEEYGCDLCGAHMPDADDMALFLAQPVEVDVVVSIGRGRSAAVGQIVVGGWGACPEHFREVTL